MKHSPNKAMAPFVQRATVYALWGMLLLALPQFARASALAPVGFGLSGFPQLVMLLIVSLLVMMIEGLDEHLRPLARACTPIAVMPIQTASSSISCLSQSFQSCRLSTPWVVGVRLLRARNSRPFSIGISFTSVPAACLSLWGIRTMRRRRLRIRAWAKPRRI